MDGSRRRQAALTLAIDVDTASVVRALRSQGVEPILLKGPVLGRLLYPGQLRPYCDIDLLVGPHDTARAEATLRDLGYRRGLPPLPPNLPTATPWSHPARRSVDLHRGLHFVEAPPEQVWEVVRREATPIEVAGTSVLAPGLGVLALHLCLHAAMSGDVVPKTLDDLERGLVTLPRAAWDDAMAAAAELGVVPTLGDGPGLSTAGARLAAELGLAGGETKVEAPQAGHHDLGTALDGRVARPLAVAADCTGRHYSPLLPPARSAPSCRPGAGARMASVSVRRVPSRYCGKAARILAGLGVRVLARSARPHRPGYGYTWRW